LVNWFSGLNPILQALIATLFTWFVTGLGAAVSVPLRREGFSRLKSFWYGQASGMVEPIAGVMGAASVILIKPILPYALAFAAGAMIYVVVEELIPESQLEKNTDIATMGAMVGFAVMMPLGVALG